MARSTGKKRTRNKHSELRERMFKTFAPASSFYVVEMSDGSRVQFPADNRLFLAERFGRILQADMDWFEHVISHQPTVGSFYEIMLRNTLKELAPSGCEIATGFVLDPYRPIHSKQLDIIAYDRISSSPVFKNGELIVVRPSAVISLTEVKKTLRHADITSTIDATMFSNLGTHGTSGRSFEGVQKVNIFGFSSKLSPSEISEKVRDYLDEKIRYTRVQHKKTKKIGSLFLQQIVLPNIFVRNDRSYITCDLVPEGEHGFSFRVRVTVHESLESDGCIGAFLLHALPMLHREQTAFIGSDLQAVKGELETKEKLQLHTLISMADVFASFPTDRAEIAGFRIKGKAPFAARISKSLNLKIVKSFSEFVKKVGKDNFETELPEERHTPD